MRALVQRDLTGPAGLHAEQVSKPEPGPNEVRVRVGAAGINFADVLQARGNYGAERPTLPFRPGLEFAGTIDAVGPGVLAYQVGDRVMGLQMGAFAEFVVAPVDSVQSTPTQWTDAQAACFPIQWVTAHACLELLGDIRAGQLVLVHACAGGVGLAAVQLAKHFGATVVGTASSQSKLDQARSVGLDHGIDTSTENLVDAMRAIGRPDLILEMVGGAVFEANLKIVRPYGRILVYGAASGEAATASNVGLVFRPVQVIGYHLMILRKKRPDLWEVQEKQLARLIDNGVIQPQPGRVWTFDEAAEAYRALEGRATVGKQVLVPA